MTFFQGIINMMKDIREVVNREDWQSLRRNFVGTWKHQPVEKKGN